MFQSMSVDRFRCFKQLQIKEMDRFNLILGMNNVGKTTLLESIFLLVGPTNPNLTLTINVFRGIEQMRIEPEEMWGWLFHDKKMTSTIKLSATHFNHKTRELTISVTEPKEIRLRSKPKSRKPRRIATATTSPGVGELLMNYLDEDGNKVKTRAYVKEGGLGITQDKKVKLPTSVFVTSRAGYTSENAERFSKLEELGKEGTILPAMQLLEPRLKRLAVLFSGAGPVIHGEIDIGRMLPLPLMGEGIGRLLTLLLAVASADDGVVLIDEIETGIHYSVMTKVWTAIANLAREKKVQIFATTHSWECLKAAHEAFSSKDAPAYDFRLHRLSREEGILNSTSYDQEMIETALAGGLELR